MSCGPDIILAAGPLLKAGWWFIPVGWGMGLLRSPSQASQLLHTDRAVPGRCVEPVAVGLLGAITDSATSI